MHGPDERLDHFEIDYLIDVDADGVDEVLVSSAYYEGRYDNLLEWQDGSWTMSTLAGDGA
ncbi:MAG: hypothetical protein HC893_04310 [Chloroflexaceae bacterium]|nr:hypothetical protein [Chloroflexaceae bacterium]